MLALFADLIKQFDDLVPEGVEGFLDILAKLLDFGVILTVAVSVFEGIADLLEAARNFFLGFVGPIWFRFGVQTGTFPFQLLADIFAKNVIAIAHEWIGVILRNTIRTFAAFGVQGVRLRLSRLAAGW